MATETDRLPHIASTSLEFLEYIEANLYTAVLSDAMDDMGIRDRVMREHLRPILPDVVVAGWAHTILCMDLYHIPTDPYGPEIEAVEKIRPGAMVVVSTGDSKRNAPWGELLSTAARARGARGAIVDGLIRDVKQTCKLGFPVFAAGIKPVDSRGRGIVVNHSVPVGCGGIVVNQGDLIVADFDGVVAISAEMADEVVRAAADKVIRENGSREELAAGALLRDVFSKYGVL